MDIKDSLQSIKRYKNIIMLKYDIKREYFTIAIPVFIAFLIFFSAILIGHTFPEGEPEATVAEAEVEDALARFKELQRQLEMEDGEVEEDLPLEDEVDVPVPDDPPLKSNLDHILIYVFLIAITPFAIDSYIQKKKARKQELAYTEFLFKLSELMRGGIDPVKSTISLSSTNLGPITNEIQQTSAEMSLGTSFADSMMHMAGRMKSKIIQKYAALVVEAANMGGGVAEIVFRSSEDMRGVIKINEEKERNLKQYVIIFYFAQGVLILITYILSIQLIPHMQGIDPAILAGAAELAKIDFRLSFFHMIMINALFGGLIIGQIAEGNIKYGLKHVVILMVGCYLISTTFILPVPIAPHEIQLEIISGADQTAIAGVPLDMPIVLKAVDNDGNPMEGVDFDINIYPSGNVTSNVTSDSDGLFNIYVTLGIEEREHTIEIMHEDILIKSIYIEAERPYN